MKTEPILEEFGRKLTIGIEFELHGDPGGIRYSGNSKTIPVESIKVGDDLNEAGFECSHIIVKELTPEHAVVAFDGEILDVPFGERVDGKQTTGSYQLRNYWLKYMPVTSFTRMMEQFNRIRSIHAGKGESVIRETTAEEQEVLDGINALIDQGCVDLYPMKALLWASNNWDSKKIVRPGLYADILQEGIEKGALDPENHRAWVWIKESIEANENMDPYTFLGDPEIIDPIIIAAATPANYFAEAVKKKIWESTIGQWWDFVESLLYEVSAAYAEGKLPEDIEQRKTDILAIIDKMISIGCRTVYPLKALLTSADDWNSCEIVRVDQYRKILKEGVEKYAFGQGARQSAKAWEYLELAMRTNGIDPLFESDEIWKTICGQGFVPMSITYLHNCLTSE